MRCATLLVLALLLFGPTTFLVASEEEEVRERAERASRPELEREIVQLHERLLDLAASTVATL